MPIYIDYTRSVVVFNECMGSRETELCNACWSNNLIYWTCIISFWSNKENRVFLQLVVHRHNDQASVDLVGRVVFSCDLTVKLGI